jgi:hypothetical protein
MKTIFDIYAIDECGLNAGAPANTLGMGNPMIPGDGDACKLGAAGSEPLSGKCKKSKKKISEEPKIKESILDNVDDQMRQGDEFAKLAPIVEWWKKQRSYQRNKTSDADELLIYERIRIENKALIIDCKNDKYTVLDAFFVKDQLPLGINTIKVYNSSGKFFVYALSEDISFVDFEIYTDEGRTYGDIFIHGGRLRSLDLGNIICCKFTIDAAKSESMLIGKNSEIIEYDLSMCHLLENFYGSFMGASNIIIPRKVLKYYLCQQGFMSWGADIDIRN